MKRIFTVLLCVILLSAFVYAEQVVGGDRDEHGCIGSAGYQWCEEKQKCLRTWEEECASIEAAQIGGEVDEHGCRISAGEFWCNRNQKCLTEHTEDCQGLQGGENAETPEDEASDAESGEPKPSTVMELQSRIQQRQQEMAQETSAMGEKEQKVYQNQNQVRLAVHALLQMEDMVGGIGPQVSEIARSFNNSIQATLNAEERIERRSAFTRFFAGGDDKAADEIQVEVNQNRVRVEQLKQLREDCNCTSDAKAIMLEQIQSMELEETRLQQLSEGEKQSKGIFGWLWK